MARKRVVLICGAAVATSAIVKMKLEKVLKQHGIEADLYKGLALEAARLAQGADLIVATTALPQGDYGVPVVNGVPLLTGIGEEETIRKIVELLKEV